MGAAAHRMPTYPKKVIHNRAPALDKTPFVWYIITMKDDIVEITFIAAISVSLIVKLLTL